MSRNPPGTVKREAPPGPEMTAEEFTRAMEQLPRNAARWRFLKQNLSRALTQPLEMWSGADLERWIDERIAAEK